MERYLRTLRKGRGGRGVQFSLTACATVACAIGAGCDTTGPPNGPLRFGQSGEIRITVEAPLYLGAGWLQQVLTWRSDGAWKVFEEIGYRGIVGEAHLDPNPGLAFEYASMYASLIQKLNDDVGFKLIGVPELDAIQDPECRSGMSRVTVRIHDDSRNETREWTRCADGNLTNLTTRGSGPDAVASRVIQAAIFVRNNTAGPVFVSTYSGSLPFGTVDRGTETGSGLTESVYFRSPDGSDQAPADWADFWGSHVGSRALPIPEIDWGGEMILVAAVGVRQEVGDSVEVRRVLAIDNGTRVEIVERVPGDFCAPARRTTRPIHIVVVPKSPEPIDFTDNPLPTESVPCIS